MNLPRYAVFAALSGALAVILGALGAHALKPMLGESIETWQTAVLYHLTHSIYLLGLTLAASKLEAKATRIAIRLCVLGILCFSGSLYLLVSLPLWGIGLGPVLGPITPIGGLLLIASYIATAVAVRKLTF